MNNNNYYWTDLSISILDIDAKSKDQAEAIIQEFIDKITPIMDTKIRWDNAEFEIKESELKNGEWVNV